MNGKEYIVLLAEALNDLTLAQPEETEAFLTGHGSKLNVVIPDDDGFVRYIITGEHHATKEDALAWSAPF